MPLGEEGDFRTQRWQVARRFPGLMERGGDGSPFLPSFNRPSGYSSIQIPPIGIPPIPNTTITLPGISITGGPDGSGIYPPPVFPPITLGGGPGIGTNGPSTPPLTVKTDNDGDDQEATYSNVGTIRFTGEGLVSVIENPTGTVIVDYSGGGGQQQSPFEYGRITAATKVTGVAKWNYTITRSNGTTFSANNLLEQGNTTALGYGYQITSGTDGVRIQGTNFTIRPVPQDVWVRAEFTGQVTGSLSYWFSAANRIDGTCA